MPTRSYQQQLDHLNYIVTKITKHKNKALDRLRNPIIFDEWVVEMHNLLHEADDEDVFTILIEKENSIPANASNDEKLDYYIDALSQIATKLANKKQSLRINEHEASSEYYLCAGDREYELTMGQFMVNGRNVHLKPQERSIMQIILSDPDRNISGPDAARKIYEDAEFVIKIPRIISDINKKIVQARGVSQNPIQRLAAIKLPYGKSSSIWHLYLQSELDQS